MTFWLPHSGQAACLPQVHCSPAPVLVIKSTQSVVLHSILTVQRGVRYTVSFWQKLTKASRNVLHPVWGCRPCTSWLLDVYWRTDSFCKDNFSTDIMVATNVNIVYWVWFIWYRYDCTSTYTLRTIIPRIKMKRGISIWVKEYIKFGSNFKIGEVILKL